MSGRHEQLNKKKVAFVSIVLATIIILIVSIVLIIVNNKKNSNVNVSFEEEIEEEKVKTFDEVIADFGGVIIERPKPDTCFILKDNVEYTLYEDGTVTEGKITIWNGTEQEPKIDKDANVIAINTPEELKWLANKVISGQDNFNGYKVELLKDLDFGARKNEDGTWTGAEWTPMIGFLSGKDSNIAEEVVENNQQAKEENLKRFSGIFEGNNHTIRGLYLNNQERYQGLFGFNAGSIFNLTVKASYIKGGNGVGAIAGLNAGMINGCHVENTTVEGQEKVGGIVGISMTGSFIQECYSDEKTVVSGPKYVGGIIGYLNNNANVSNCVNRGNVKGNDYVGGIVGIAFFGTPIIGSINQGKNVIGQNYVGGIAGYSQAEINTCKNISEGSVTGDVFVGGIVGSNYLMGIVQNCYNTCKVIVKEDTAGGIAGINNALIQGTYNKGKVALDQTSTARVGGICGQNSTNSIVQKSYNLGEIKNNVADGVVGMNYGTCNDCFCVENLGYSSNSGGEMISAEDLKTDKILYRLGEAFKNDENSLNNGYPILSWQNADNTKVDASINLDVQ